MKRTVLTVGGSVGLAFVLVACGNGPDQLTGDADHGVKIVKDFVGSQYDTAPGVTPGAKCRWWVSDKMKGGTLLAHGEAKVKGIKVPREQTFVMYPAYKGYYFYTLGCPTWYKKGSKNNK